MLYLIAKRYSNILLYCFESSACFQYLLLTLKSKFSSISDNSFSFCKFSKFSRNLKVQCKNLCIFTCQSSRNFYSIVKNTAFKHHTIKSRKENPQKLTQLSSRSHPRHLVGKRTAQKTPT